MAPSVLVVRPEPGASETVAVLEEAGIPARALPVMERRPLPETPAARSRIEDLDAIDVVVFVSPTAVALGMQWIDTCWPQYPARTRWVAVGARTRMALAAWGVQVSAPADDERSEGMLALPELTAVHDARILIMRGRGGREVLADTLRERGATVEVLELYERVGLRVALPDAASVAAVVVSSVAVLDALCATGGAALRDRPLVLPSQRVADAAAQAGFGCIRVAAGASPAATLAALRQHRQLLGDES